MMNSPYIQLLTRGRRFPLAILIALSSSIAGCGSKPIREVPIFPGNLGVLDQSAPAPAASLVEKTLNVPIEKVLSAAQVVLHQNALVLRARRLDDKTLGFSYISRTTIPAGNTRRPVEMIFSMKLTSIDADSTSIRIESRWDLMTDDVYQKADPARFERLKSAMLSEALFHLERLSTQSGVRSVRNPASGGSS